MVKSESGEEEVQLFEYVMLGITDVFNELAEKLSEMDLEHDVAAAIPFGLYHAEMHLKTAWARYVADMAAKGGRGEEGGRATFEERVKALREWLEEDKRPTPSSAAPPRKRRRERTS